MIRPTSIYLGRTQPEDGAYFYGLPRRRRREGEGGGEEGEQSEVAAALALAAASSSGGDDDEVDSVHGECAYNVSRVYGLQSAGYDV